MSAKPNPKTAMVAIRILLIALITLCASPVTPARADTSVCGAISGDTIWKRHGKRHDKNKIQKILNYLHHEKRLVQLNDGRYLLPENLAQVHYLVRNAKITGH